MEDADPPQAPCPDHCCVRDGASRRTPEAVLRSA
jgi:hypothetical protein